MLVTGANGFLGSYVVAALLKEGHPVIGLKRKESSTAEFDKIIKHESELHGEELLKNFTWKEADILDIVVLDEVLENASVVFHCAAKVDFSSRFKDEMMAVNITGTMNVVNACLKNNVKKLVHVSSTSALGRTENDKLITEETEWEPNDNNTNYSISKHLGELEVWRGIEEGLNAVIVNPCIILGYGEWEKGSCRIFNNIENGLRFYTNGINGFVDARDVAKIMLLLADSGISAQRFLVISENKTYRSILDEMAAALHRPKPNIELKNSYKRLLIFIVKIIQFIRPNSTITPETINTSLHIHRYSNEKIKGVFDYKFNPVGNCINEVGASLLKEQHRH